jgi:hypothetical protein
MQLPDFLIADGTPLYKSGGGTAALTVAKDEDWLDVLEQARINISNGSMGIAVGETFEQALANNAKRLLEMGIYNTKNPAMGRTSDEAAWAVQQERWVGMVFDVAARGSCHQELVRGTNPPEHVLTGTVFTVAGRVPLADVPRSTR